jgi:hypothetical protein
MVPPYADAGREQAGKVWVATPELGATNGTKANCQKVHFTQSFEKTPTVLVTATHRDPSDMDWGGVSPPSVTYVTEVTGKYFRVCSNERDGLMDSTLSWDWVVFGPAWGEGTGLGLANQL